MSWWSITSPTRTSAVTDVRALVHAALDRRVRVRVDDAGRHELAGRVHHRQPGRQLHVGADGGDLAVLDQDRALLDPAQRPRGQERRAHDRERRVARAAPAAAGAARRRPSHRRPACPPCPCPPSSRRPCSGERCPARRACRPRTPSSPRVLGQRLARPDGHVRGLARRRGCRCGRRCRAPPRRERVSARSAASRGRPRSIALRTPASAFGAWPDTSANGTPAWCRARRGPLGLGDLPAVLLVVVAAEEPAGLRRVEVDADQERQLARLQRGRPAAPRARRRRRDHLDLELVAQRQRAPQVVLAAWP